MSRNPTVVRKELDAIGDALLRWFQSQDISESKMIFISAAFSGHILGQTCNSEEEMKERLCFLHKLLDQKAEYELEQRRIPKKVAE